jgi:hypothetical protein
VIFAPIATLEDAQRSLQDAIVSYLKADVKAEEKEAQQLSDDWVESGRSMCGLLRRVAA